MWTWKENLFLFIWIDINECEASPCQHECINTDGSYICYCRPGYKLSKIDGKSCNGNASTPLLITNAKVLGFCRCLTSPHLSHFLTDIDECSPQTEDDAPQTGNNNLHTSNRILQTNKNLCAYLCSNTDGSYHCTCPPSGYTMAPDGRTCQGGMGCICARVRLWMHQM